jgi:hypothetical protein
MSKSIAEMRASRSTPRRPERTMEMCLAQDVAGEIASLLRRRNELATEVRLNEDGQAVHPDGSPAKAAEGGTSPEVAEINDRLRVLYAEMNEHTGELTLRGIDAGDWRRWVDEHPARIDGQDNNGRPIDHPFDADVAYGFCNATDLLARLGDFVVSWNGEPVSREDWDFLRANAVGGDLKQAARLVVQMHEGEAARAPKLPSPSSGTPIVEST